MLSLEGHTDYITTLSALAGVSSCLQACRSDVGAAEVEEDDEPFEEKMERLTASLREQMQEAERLDQTIKTILRKLGLGNEWKGE